MIFYEWRDVVCEWTDIYEWTDIVYEWTDDIL